ncbi:MAG: CpsD/CapB family tyrosine-protein kinase [Gammaproteobacteria bacterium]|nr:CpsD/CapB family tyrosine-protein kinase [Gammaproteobacteria bacterium]
MSEFFNKRTLNPRLVHLLRPHSGDAQRYQRLRLAVENIPRKTGGVVVAIASPSSGEGKTLTAINLAGALAQNPASKVMLIELDLRSTQGTLKDYLGARKWSPRGVVDGVVEGLGDSIADVDAEGAASSAQIDWQQIAHSVPEFNLTLIPSGQKTESPYEVLNSPQLERLINQARLRFDYIILDTAPVTLYPDTQLISRWVDQFIVLVTAGMTSRKELAACLDLMVPEKVLGLVFNECQHADGERHGY